MYLIKFIPGIYTEEIKTFLPFEGETFYVFFDEV